MAIKLLHISCAYLTILLFVLRAGWLLVHTRLPDSRALRVLPHIIDTLLLACGVTLAVQLQLNPLEEAWLGIKLLAVVAYILLGFVVLKWARTVQARVAAFALALATFAFILSVAHTHRAIPWVT